MQKTLDMFKFHMDYNCLRYVWICLFIFQTHRSLIEQGLAGLSLALGCAFDPKVLISKPGTGLILIIDNL